MRPQAGAEVGHPSRTCAIAAVRVARLPRRPSRRSGDSPVKVAEGAFRDGVLEVVGPAP